MLRRDLPDDNSSNHDAHALQHVPKRMNESRLRIQNAPTSSVHPISATAGDHNTNRGAHNMTPLLSNLHINIRSM